MTSGKPWSSASPSASTKAWSGSQARVPTPVAGAAYPERCLEAYHLQRTRFERIAERKLRRRQLTEDGNIEITGRDLRERSQAAF